MLDISFWNLTQNDGERVALKFACRFMMAATWLQRSQEETRCR
jgi:hypothetical protein